MAAPILVPLDGSAFGEQALPIAASLARRTGSELHIVRVHVLTVPVAYPEATVYFSAELEDRLRQSEREYLESVASRFPDVPTRTALLEGSIVNALEEYITEHEIRLIVMTTHGRSGFSRAWLGSIAESLIRHVKIPVLLRRPSAEQAEPAPDLFSHILVPLDGSALAESILEPATSIGELTNAHYTLVQVIPPPDEFTTVESAIAITLTPESIHQIELDAVEYLERVAKRLRESGHDVKTTVIVHRQPAVGIVEKATELGADLIALATHGRSGLQRVALGSVADKIVRGTSLPILIWRPPNVSALSVGRARRDQSTRAGTGSAK